MALSNQRFVVDVGGGTDAPLNGTTITPSTLILSRNFSKRGSKTSSMMSHRSRSMVDDIGKVVGMKAKVERVDDTASAWDGKV